jgi:hypothetical protein
VRLRRLQRRKRTAVLWYGIGFLVVQLALAVCIDRRWPAIRDPEFDGLERAVRDRHAEAPQRPLVLAFGSSRTKMALRAARLNRPEDENGPLVINGAMLGGGPMMHQIVLRRLLDDGIRPHLIFVEIMPLSLSARQGAPVEERLTFIERFTAEEVARLWTYYAQPIRLYYPWLMARVVPCRRHRAELRHALAIDVPVGAKPGYADGCDGYGWLPGPKTVTAAEVERMTRDSLATYVSALTQPALAPGAVRAFRDFVHLCQQEHIAVVLVMPPESSAFRQFAPAVGECHVQAVRDLAAELAVPLIDARAWVDDDGFYDGHHTTEYGADQYTERFAREVFLRRQP